MSPLVALTSKTPPEMGFRVEFVVGSGGLWVGFGSGSGLVRVGFNLGSGRTRVGSASMCLCCGGGMFSSRPEVGLGLVSGFFLNVCSTHTRGVFEMFS